MSSQLATLSATLPPVGTPAVVPGSMAPPTAPDPVAGAVPAAQDDPAVVALLQQLVSILSQLLAVSTAQAGAAGVAAPLPAGATVGGGSAAAGEPGPGGPRTPNVVSLEALSAAAAGGGGAMLGGGAPWSGAFTIQAASGAVTGGGPAAPVWPPSSTLGGSGGDRWSIVAGADAAPVAAPGAAVLAGGAAAPVAPRVDMQRVSGTPQAGGVIDTILRAATPTAAEARSDGSWLVLGDANGARLQAHVHGTWAADPTRIAEGVQRGLLQVHVHADGTLHLHDVA